MLQEGTSSVAPARTRPPGQGRTGSYFGRPLGRTMFKHGPAGLQGLIGCINDSGLATARSGTMPTLELAQTKPVEEPSVPLDAKSSALMACLQRRMQTLNAMLARVSSLEQAQGVGVPLVNGGAAAYPAVAAHNQPAGMHADTAGAGASGSVAGPAAGTGQSGPAPALAAGSGQKVLLTAVAARKTTHVSLTPRGGAGGGGMGSPVSVGPGSAPPLSLAGGAAAAAAAAGAHQAAGQGLQGDALKRGISAGQYALSLSLPQTSPSAAAAAVAAGIGLGPVTAAMAGLAAVARAAAAGSPNAAVAVLQQAAAAGGGLQQLSMQQLSMHQLALEGALGAPRPASSSVLSPELLSSSEGTHTHTAASFHAKASAATVAGGSQASAGVVTVPHACAGAVGAPGPGASGTPAAAATAACKRQPVDGSAGSLKAR